MRVEPTPDPGWLYCPRCNTVTDWQASSSNCSVTGLCLNGVLTGEKPTFDTELPGDVSIKVRVTNGEKRFFINGGDRP